MIDDPSKQRLRKKLLRHGLVLACFVLLAALHLRPIWHFQDGLVIGLVADGVMNAFHMWWMKYAVTHGSWPFFSPFLYHPIGAEMYWHTLAPIKAAWGLVLLPFFEPIAAYNLLVIGTLIASGYTAWLLLRYLIADVHGEGWITDTAAFAGASVFMLSGYLLINVIGHINLLSAEGIPLFLLFYLKYKRSGERKHLLYLGLTALYVILCDFYYFTYIGVFMAFDAAYIIYTQEGTVLSLRPWRSTEIHRTIKAAFAALLGGSPMLLILLWHLLPAPINFNHSGSNYPLDPVGLILPGHSSFWINLFPRIVQKYFIERMAHGWQGMTDFFIGWMTPAIAFYALYRNIGCSRRLMAIGLAFLLISFGPFLSIGGQTMLSVWKVSLFALLCCVPFYKHRWVRDVMLVLLLAVVVDLTIGFTLHKRPAKMALPLPYIFFQNLVPFFGRGGSPYRMVVMLYLALAACFGFSVSALARRQWRWKLGAIEILLIALIIPSLEYLRIPVSFVPIPRLPEDIAEQIRREPPDIAVFTDDYVFGQLEVTQHEHPVSYARLSREPQSALTEHRKSIYQVFWRGERTTPQNTEEIRAYILEHHFKYAIFHGAKRSRDVFLREQLQAKSLYSDKNFQVYKLYD